MVEYADFHTLTATLSPVFFFAGLIAHIRLVAALRGQTPKVWAFLLIIATLGMMIGLVVLSLLILGGFIESTPERRVQSIIYLGIQVATGAGAAFWDAMQLRRP